MGHDLLISHAPIELMVGTGLYLPAYIKNINTSVCYMEIRYLHFDKQHLSHHHAQHSDHTYHGKRSHN